ncbi:uncharacterized protein [Palaemon carinicauda]|uniref:uncharacterized protein isoform X2 n=1 Tax=Palaemon carinicauda TaxID=392227 RepID=UPI0035B5F57C
MEASLLMERKQIIESEGGKKGDKEVPSHQKDGESLVLEGNEERENSLKNREDEIVSQTNEVNGEMIDVMKELIDKDLSECKKGSDTGDDPKTSCLETIKVESGETQRKSLTEEKTNESGTEIHKRRRRECKDKQPLKDDFVYEWGGNQMKGKRKRQEESDGNDGGRGPFMQKKRVCKRGLEFKLRETKVKSGNSCANENGRTSKVSSYNTRKNLKKSDGDNLHTTYNRISTRKGSKKMQNKDIDCEEKSRKSSKKMQEGITINCEGKSLQVIRNTEKSHQEQTAECIDNALGTKEIKEGGGSFIILPNATQRGKMKLISSDGFTFIVKHRLKGKTVWTCCYRPKKKPYCDVRVEQHLSYGTFEVKGTHIHSPKSAEFARSYIDSLVKKKSKTDFTSNPKELITEILDENVDLNTTGYDFNVDYLIRKFNRVRHTLKQKNPTIGVVKMRYIPKDFLQEDIIFKDNRYMIFSTKKQFELLSRSDRWYIDITQKFVSSPFEYLMSISAYVLVKDSGDIVMLKPLVFILLSRAEREDFRKAIRGLIKHLRKPLCVRSFVLDFHPGLWSAIRNLFFNCKLYGCAWKFGQTLWAKVQEWGKKEEIILMNIQLHKLLKLPFLPAREIRLAFQLLKEEISKHSSFEQLINHLENTWLNNSVWRIANWSVCGSPFRTKSDVINWHYSIPLVKNKISHRNLIKALHRISCSLSSVQKPVHQGNVKKFYKENLKTPQGKMFLLWEEESVMSYSDFLEKCCLYSEASVEINVENITENKR